MAEFDLEAAGESLRQHLMDIGHAASGFGFPISTFRAIVIPKQSEFQFRHDLEFLSTSLDGSSSLHSFGISRLWNEDTQEIDTSKKIVFQHILLDASAPILPMFLHGFQADTEQEVVVVPSAHMQRVVESYQKNVDGAQLLHDLARHFGGRAESVLRSSLDILADPNVQVDLATIRIGAHSGSNADDDGTASS